MRVGIDAHFVTRLPRRGIGTYSLNFITAVTKSYPSVDFFIYIRHPDCDNALPNLPNVTIRLIKSYSDPLWEQILVPLSIRNDNLDIFHSLGNTAPLFLPRGLNRVLSLMDVMFLQDGGLIPLPTNFYQRMGRIYRRFITPFISFKFNYFKWIQIQSATGVKRLS
jgi:hypothetical protein